MRGLRAVRGLRVVQRAVWGLRAVQVQRGLRALMLLSALPVVAA